MEIRKIRECEKHEKNPFLEKAIQAIEGGIVRKYRSASRCDQKAILQAVDSNGEILGHTSFIRQIEVDEEKFAKFYLSHFSSFFDLNPSSIKVFSYILKQLEPGKDMVLFFLGDCIKHTGYKTAKPIYQGLSHLIASEIIARGRYDNIYFINPLVVFNGNRVTFAKSYVKRAREVNKSQVKLFEF